MPIRIHSLISAHSVSDLKFAQWLEQEREYLSSKQSEPESDILGIEYVELLNKYNEAQYILNSII
jgi:hypothetical protein